MDVVSGVVDKWHQFSFLLGGAIFVAYVFVDGCWAYYTLSIEKRKPVSAATVGSLTYFLLAIGIVNYVQNYLYLIPLALGSWVGTYLVVTHDMRGIRGVRNKL